MKKTLLTISFLALTIAYGFAGNNPFEKIATKSNVQEKVNELNRKLIPVMSQLSNQRVASFYPDSVTIYDHDGAAWIMMNTAKVNYNSSGQFSSIVLYLPPPLNLPFLSITFQYNAAGKLTRMQQNQLVPASVVMMRIDQNYDANQNKTSTKIYEDDNGSLTLVDGDSVLYSYVGSSIDGITTSYYDGSMPGVWLNETRIQGIQYGANLEPIALEFQEWDDQTTSWSPEISRFTGLVWGFGYAGLMESLGIMEINANDFLGVMPTADYSVTFGPTGYLNFVVMGSVVDTLDRSSSTMTGGLVSQVLVEDYFSGGWEPSYRTNYAYDASNRLVSAIEESYDGMSWEDSYRYVWEYNAQGNLTKEMEEYNFTGTWEVSYGSEYGYQYTTTNTPFEVITNEYDFNTSNFEPSERMVYNFGSFPTAISTQSIQSLSAFPNPVLDQLTIRADLVQSDKLTIEVLNIAGQVVYSENVMANAGFSQHIVSFEGFDQGVYLVRLSGSYASKILRIVK